MLFPTLNIKTGRDTAFDPLLRLLNLTRRSKIGNANALYPVMMLQERSIASSKRMLRRARAILRTAKYTMIAESGSKGLGDVAPGNNRVKVLNMSDTLLLVKTITLK